MAITKDSENLYSSMRFVGDGVTKRVPLTFDLREGDGLAVDFGEGLVTSGYLIDYDVTPVVVLFSEPLPKGKTITIRRLTKIDTVKHVFQWTGNAQGGADFSAKNVDENFEQITRASQDAMDSQTLATETLEEMAGIKDAALDAKESAKASADEAKGYELGAETAQTEANKSAVSASESAQSAKDSEIKAKAWATNPVDEEVETGKYSAYHWANKAKEIVGFDPDEYRKKDDLLFNGMMQVQATDDVGAGVLLLDKDGNPRGQMTYNSGGLQFAQHSADGESYMYTLPDESGVLALSKYSNLVSITEFGAKFDGITNDTDAWLEAITHCREEGKTLTLPKGVSVVTPDTIDPKGVSIVGVAGGYFNRAGSVVEATQKTGAILKQSDLGAGNITFTWSNILFRKCNDAFDLGYAVNCSFNNVFLEDSSGSFRLGRPSVLGSLWCSFRNCQTNTDGAGLILDGSVMANSNYFEACAFKGKLPSRVHASGGYGAIGNTFVATEFFGGGIGLELGSNRNTNLISCYFESKDHSIYITGITRGLSLTNPIFSVHESVDGKDPTYIKHSAGVLDVNITNPIVYVTDKDTTKGMSLFRSYSDAFVRRVSVTNPIVNVSGGTEQSLDFKLVRGVPISKLRGGFKEMIPMSETGLKCDLIYLCGEITTVRGRVDILEHSETGLFEVNLQGVYSDPAHNIVGDCLVRYGGSEAVMYCRINSGRNRLYITKPNGQNLRWDDLSEGDFMFLNVQLT